MPKSRIACLICRSELSRRDEIATRWLVLPGPFEVQRCSSCSFRWLNPHLTEEEAFRLHNHPIYFRRVADGPAAHPEWPEFSAPRHDYELEVLPYYRRAYVARLDRLAKLLPEGGSILDVGARTGEFVAEARARGWDATGIEVSDYGVRGALKKHGLKLMQCGLAEFAATSKYDVIHLHHVFEHFLDPRTALRKLTGLMHEHSLLVIEVPNQFESLYEIAQALIDSDRQRTVYSLHHPCFYSARTLRLILEDAGLSVQSLRSHLGDRFRGSVKGLLWGRVDWLGEKIGHRGRYIEAIARL